MQYDFVIVGGGAGGLELAARLGKRFGKKYGPDKVLLIDRATFHIWKPTLHEVAVGTLNPQQEGLSYNILARRNHFSYMVGDLIGLDAKDRRIDLAEVYNNKGELIIPQRRIYYNDCVLAVGSGSNFFDTPGAEHAFVLEHALDAQKFQRHLLDLFAKAAYAENKLLNVAIVGAGATGVELSAEMMEAYYEIRQSSGLGQRFRIQITLIEAASRILAGLNEKVSDQAKLTLEYKTIKVSTDTKVLQIYPDRLQTSKGDINCDVVVWAAGIKAAENNKTFGLEVNNINQFVVNAQLQTSEPHTYAMGDCSSCIWEGDKKLPARAQVAHQQAKYLEKLLLAEVREKTFTQEFVYKDAGSLVSLGENKGVGNLSNLFVKGMMAKYMYMSLHLLHHKQILGFSNTVLLALARLAHKRVSGHMKLH